MNKVRSLDLDPLPTPRKRWGRVLLTLLLTLALAPVAYESASRCIANWQSMLGPDVYVRTPVLDTIHAVLSRCVAVFHHKLSDSLQSSPWEPSVVIFCGIALAVLASASLRRIF